MTSVMQMIRLFDVKEGSPTGLPSFYYYTIPTLSLRFGLYLAENGFHDED